MTEILEFPVLLRLIDERSVAFRAAVASASSLDARVPTCPEWTFRDLVHHLGGVQRRWAGIVTAGPADARPDVTVSDAPQECAALLTWSAESTEQLLGALREFGPARGCWTWWGGSRSPQTSGAVARHQVQEAMVHAYDAEITVGEPRPLPSEAALDGVDEFLSTCCAGTDPWPHEPAAVEYHATEGRSWRLSLAADGARVTELLASATGAGGDAAGATLQGTAGELVLALYDRIPVNSLKADGDPRLFDLLLAWDPTA